MRDRYQNTRTYGEVRVIGLDWYSTVSWRNTAYTDAAVAKKSADAYGSKDFTHTFW